jgi:hypothetical protein
LGIRFSPHFCCGEIEIGEFYSTLQQKITSAIPEAFTMLKPDSSGYFLIYLFTNSNKLINNNIMKRITVRNDLMSKSEYSKQYGVNRMTIDRMIQDGKLSVERISGTDYIKLSMNNN